MAIKHRYVNTDNGGSADGLSFATGWTSLGTAISNLAGDQGGDDVIVHCKGTAADTSLDLTLSGITNYASITIQTDSAEANSRHSGQLSTSHYRLQGAPTADILDIQLDNVTIDGLQFVVTNSFRKAIQVTVNSLTTTVKNCIFKGNSPTTNSGHIGLYMTGRTGNTLHFIRNIVYDFYYGVNVSISGYDLVWYNNTVHNVTTGLRTANAGGTNTRRLKNNLVQSAAGSCYDIGGTATDDYATNLSEDTTAPGGDAIQNTAVTFVDEANDDFHLSTSDTGARNQGTDLSADSYFPHSTDIDGDTITGSWDIGADEAASAGGPTAAIPVVTFTLDVGGGLGVLHEIPVVTFQLIPVRFDQPIEIPVVSFWLQPQQLGSPGQSDQAAPGRRSRWGRWRRWYH